MTTFEIKRNDKTGNPLPPIVLTEGMTLTKVYTPAGGSSSTIKVRVDGPKSYVLVDGGGLLDDGLVFGSLSTLATRITGHPQNGYDWFGLTGTRKGKASERVMGQAPAKVESPAIRAAREAAQRAQAELQAMVDAERKEQDKAKAMERLVKAQAAARDALKAFEGAWVSACSLHGKDPGLVPDLDDKDLAETLRQADDAVEVEADDSNGTIPTA